MSAIGLRIRPAVSDADLEAFRGVRRALHPTERAPTVEELRRSLTPEALLLVAELDGAVVGSGLANRAETSGSSFVLPRVVPHARRRGVGTALLRELAHHAAALDYPDVGSRVEDEGSLAFAERFGFREVRREVEQVRTVGQEAWPAVPDGIALASIAERPELFDRVYRELATEALADFATDRPLHVSLEDWRRDWATSPEGSFVALAGDELVGFAGLLRDDDEPARAENSLTAVRRDHRRRGLATLIKRAVLAWAAEHGVEEIYTWTQRGNDGMRAVNERLGYEYRNVTIVVRRPLRGLLSTVS